MSSKLLKVQMNRSTVSTAIVGSSCGKHDVAERLGGRRPVDRGRLLQGDRASPACRAVRNRNAKGKDRHASNSTTVSRALADVQVDPEQATPVRPS